MHGNYCSVGTGHQIRICSFSLPVDACLTGLFQIKLTMREGWGAAIEDLQAADTIELRCICVSCGEAIKVISIDCMYAVGQGRADQHLQLTQLLLSVCHC